MVVCQKLDLIECILLLFCLIAGRYAVPISSLHTPPKQLMCRPICRPWVDELKKKLCFNPQKNITVLSCLVDPDELQEERLFKGENVENYKMVTLGGNHLRTAAKELKEEGLLPPCINKLEVI